jgi:RNA polymerase sigma-70 factor (ECF subfamily)
MAMTMTDHDAGPLPVATVPVPGRGASFDQVFLEAYPRLVRSLTLVCRGDAEAAADCVADAFERAFVRWRKVSRLDDPVGWIRRVAINRATDGGRRLRRRDRAVERLASSTPVATELPEPADTTLADAVAALSPQQRAVVALFYLDDLSVAEVAATMELSEGAVKYHLHEARERLRTTWNPAGAASAPTTPIDGANP